MVSKAYKSGHPGWRALQGWCMEMVRPCKSITSTSQHLTSSCLMPLAVTQMLFCSHVGQMDANVLLQRCPANATPRPAVLGTKLSSPQAKSGCFLCISHPAPHEHFKFRVLQMRLPCKIIPLMLYAMHLHNVAIDTEEACT